MELAMTCWQASTPRAPGVHRYVSLGGLESGLQGPGWSRLQERFCTKTKALVWGSSRRD